MIVLEAWKMGAIVGSIAAVLGIFGWLAISRANLKADLAQARGDYSLCKAANDEWLAKSVELKAAWDKYKQEAKDNAEKVRIAQNRANQLARTHVSRAKAIMTAKVAKGNEAEQARALLKTYFLRREKK